MTATRKILLLLFCTTASFALAAQETKDDASKSEEKPKMEGLFDLQGRRITERELRQGIFVVNGKKRVVR